MDVLVLGAGQDVGRSCFLLTVSNRRLLLDCGAHHGFSDARRFPDFASIPTNVLSTLDAVLISHFHFDHVAALPLLKQQLSESHQIPIYMTEPTLHLSRLMLYDVCSTSAARKQHCPFTERDIDACLQNVHIIHPNESTSIGLHADIFVTPFHAGHTLGAVMFYIRVANFTVLYTGDYSATSDAFLRPAEVPFALNPHLLITEATYCLSGRTQGRLEQHRFLMNTIISTLTRAGKILIPISAFGRVHTICAMFTSYANIYPLHEVPMYVATGLAMRANQIYDNFSTSDWTLQPSKESCIQCSVALKHDGNKRSRFSTSCVHSFTANLRPFNRTEHWDNVVLGRGPAILFATPGTLASGLSRDVFKVWSSDPNNLVISPGVCFAHTVAANIMTDSSPQTSLEPEIVQQNVLCQMVNMSVNCHADGKDITRMCKHINPKSVMLVHGEQTKVIKFQKQLQDLLHVPCFAPANGETVHISAQICSDAKQQISSQDSSLSHPLIVQYERLLDEQKSTPASSQAP